MGQRLGLQGDFDIMFKLVKAVFDYIEFIGRVYALIEEFPDMLTK